VLRARALAALVGRRAAQRARRRALLARAQLDARLAAELAGEQVDRAALEPDGARDVHAQRVGHRRVARQARAHLALGEDAREAVDVELAAVHLEVDDEAAQVDRLHERTTAAG
jgi:hypothetical protein